jgi:hypothetical protein
VPALRLDHPLGTARNGDPADHVLVPELPARHGGGSVSDVTVRCDGTRQTGWTCAVAISEDGRELTNHNVRVDAADLERLAPAADDPAALVTASFDFLLERESPQSILRSFDLMDISRYFPEYASEIGRSLRGE